MDLSHLHALELRLSNEQQRLTESSIPDEVRIRMVWINQIKKEIEAEKTFLGLTSIDMLQNMSDAELLDQLLKD